MHGVETDELVVVAAARCRCRRWRAASRARRRTRSAAARRRTSRARSTQSADSGQTTSAASRASTARRRARCIARACCPTSASPRRRRAGHAGRVTVVRSSRSVPQTATTATNAPTAASGPSRRGARPQPGERRVCGDHERRHAGDPGDARELQHGQRPALRGPEDTTPAGTAVRTPGAISHTLHSAAHQTGESGRPARRRNQNAVASSVPYTTLPHADAAAEREPRGESDPSGSTAMPAGADHDVTSSSKSVIEYASVATNDEPRAMRVPPPAAAGPAPPTPTAMPTACGVTAREGRPPLRRRRRPGRARSSSAPAPPHALVARCGAGARGDRGGTLRPRCGRVGGPAVRRVPLSRQSHRRLDRPSGMARAVAADAPNGRTSRRSTASRSARRATCMRLPCAPAWAPTSHTRCGAAARCSGSPFPCGASRGGTSPRCSRRCSAWGPG